MKRVAMFVCIEVGLGIGACRRVDAEEKSQTVNLGRFLLVASEGLYVVESDGSCSWSYHPAPYGQQVKALEDDIIYDGWALPNDHYLFSTHRYIREIDRD